ncbi:hypothetical protein WJX84_006597, partial [Apatococcus fuscideae]
MPVPDQPVEMDVEDDTLLPEHGYEHQADPLWPLSALEDGLCGDRHAQLATTSEDLQDKRCNINSTDAEKRLKRKWTETSDDGSRAAISSAIKTLLANMKERNGAQDADMNIRPVVASILLALQAKSMPDSSPCISNMDPEEARRFARSVWVLTWLPELVFVSMEALSQQTQAEGCTAFTLDSSLLTRLLASKGGLRALASPRVLDLIFPRQTNDSEKQQLERQAQSQPALQVAPLVNRAQPARMQQNHLAAALNQSTCFGFNEHQQLTKNECTPDNAPQASSHGQIVLSEMQWQRALRKLDAMDFHSQKAQSSPPLFLHQQPGDQ